MPTLEDCGSWGATIGACAGVVMFGALAGSLARHCESTKSLAEDTMAAFVLSICFMTLAGLLIGVAIYVAIYVLVGIAGLACSMMATPTRGLAVITVMMTMVGYCMSRWG